MNHYKEAFMLDYNPLGHTDPYILSQFTPITEIKFPEETLFDQISKKLNKEKILIICNPSGVRYV